MTDNYIDENGLHTQTLQEIVDDVVTKLKAVYGEDINVDANSPDGQMINIYAQAKADLLDTITSVYNSFSPENATGRVQDQRYAINGIIRRGATYTTTEVTITADRTVTLYGLDTNPSDPFTVSDGAGNNFYLAETVTLSSGDTTVIFRAAESGEVATTIGTITQIETITLGITAVDNESSAINQGIDEETDADFRIRRQASVSLQSTGFLEGLESSLKNISNVVDAAVYENNTGVTDGDGIPGHSIWCIIDGGEESEIADVIYRKRNAGCGMYGSASYGVTQVNGTTFTVYFDRPTYEDLYIDMTLESLDPLHAIDDDYIKNAIYNNFSYLINQIADFTAITTWVKEFDPLAVVLSGGVSNYAGGYAAYLETASIANRFVMSTSRINITLV